MEEKKKENFALEKKKSLIQADEVEIDLLDLTRYVLKFWPLLILGLLVGGLAMGGLRYMKNYTYSSTSMLYVLSSTTSITSLSDLELGSRLSDDYLVMIKSNPVLEKAVEEVEEKTGKKMSREEAAEALSVTHSTDSCILTIKCTTEDAELSKVLCDAITNEAAERVSEITQTDSPTLVESAEVADKPNSRGVVSGIEKGGLVGFVAVAAILCLIYLLNDKIRKADDVENYLGEVVIGVIPYEKSLIFRKKKKR